MLRVSSRQRLVSWDAFDASTDEAPDGIVTMQPPSQERVEDSRPPVKDDGHDDGCPITPLGRKRERDFGAAIHQCPQSLSMPHLPLSAITNPSKECCSVGANCDDEAISTAQNVPLSPDTLVTLPESDSDPEPVPSIDAALMLPDKDVPIWYWEAGLPKFHDLVVDASDIENLMDDVMLHIVAFLDLSSIRNLMGTSQKFRRFLSSNDAHHLWVEQWKRTWPALAKHGEKIPIDRLSLPTAVTYFEDHMANLPLLLSLAPEAGTPSGIDQDCVELHNTRRRFHRSAHRHSHSHLFRYLARRNDDETESLPKLLMRIDDKTGLDVMRYTGPVGSGDRCVRADRPLPRPTRRASQKWMSSPPSPTLAAAAAASTATAMIFGANPHLIERLCRSAAKAVALKNWTSNEMRPFVAPIVGKDGETVDLTPRMVSYYEVSILNDDASNPEPEFPARRLSIRGQPVSDCVAVGLATEDFHLYSRMPGWDSFSFGYHGDDGGTFHASGGMLEQFGPPFGRGDTVGCGVDYVKRGIFFTLNGKFLGYGWRDMDVDLLLDQDLYPTIGIDTNASVRFNFGTQPFQFDLSKVTADHEEEIKSQFKWSPLAMQHHHHHHHIHAKVVSPASPTHRRFRKHHHRGFRRLHRHHDRQQS